MKLVCISDTHGLHRQVRLPRGDVLVHSGDVSQQGTLTQVTDFLTWFAAVGDFRHRVMIAGNHDFAFERSPALINLPAGVIYLHDTGVILDGVHFWGSPYTPAFGNWAFGQSEEQLRDHWGQIPEDVDVLITHGPPLGILDRVLPSGQAVGCPQLLRAVQRARPRVHLFGHIHEAYGECSVGETRFVNAALCDPQYRLVQAPRVIPLDGGHRFEISGHAL